MSRIYVAIIILCFSVNRLHAQACWTPDGKSLMFTSDKDGQVDLYQFHIRTLKFKRITTDTIGEMHASFVSIKGKGKKTKILYDANYGGNRDIYLMNPDGTDRLRLTSNPAADLVPVYNGESKIYFNSQRDGNFEVYVMDINGGSQQNLTNSSSNDFIHSLSWDKTRILFDSDRSGPRAIFEMNLDGSDVRQITFPEEGQAHRIAIGAPDNAIAYSAKVGLKNEAMLIVQPGGRAQLLVDTSGNDIYPQWSPNEKLISFISDVEGYREVFIIEKNGNVRQLTNKAIKYDGNPARK